MARAHQSILLGIELPCSARPYCTTSYNLYSI
jgi:hypothetical protein